MEAAVGYVRGLVTGLALFWVAGAAVGQTPSRLARLVYAEGYVHVDRAGDTVAGDPAQLNMPLVEGQTVVTGDNGQAEVEFEDGSLARLTPNSSLVLARLGVEGGSTFHTELALAKGLAYFELRVAPRFAYTVSAGADRITPVENATFRVALDEPPAAVAMLDGAARVERAGSFGTDLRAGESFRGDPESTDRYFLTQEIVPDSWDQWNESRDQMAADAASQNTAARDGYAGTQGYGWSDLDANGRWYDVAGQGEVWQPAGGDAAGFDPYGNGSWVWSGGAGYVWASSYAWGWTPFRCGGWSYWDSFGWGWTPNSACAGFGYAGYGYGGYGGYPGRLNVVHPPLQYPGHLPPPRHGGSHPVVPVHEVASGIRPVVTPPGERRIGGIVATPVTSGSASYTSRGGSAVGSSLRRDYPVDSVTQRAILGVQPGQGAARPGFVSGAMPGAQQPRGIAPGIGGQRSVPGYVNGAGSTHGYVNGAGSSHGYVNGSGPAPGYVNGAGSGFGPNYVPGRAPGVQRSAPAGTPPGGYPHTNMQSAPRPAPSFAPAPRMSMPAPAPAAPHVSAPPGGGGKK